MMFMLLPSCFSDNIYIWVKLSNVYAKYNCRGYWNVCFSTTKQINKLSHIVAVLMLHFLFGVKEIDQLTTMSNSGTSQRKVPTVFLHTCSYQIFHITLGIITGVSYESRNMLIIPRSDKNVLSMLYTRHTFEALPLRSLSIRAHYL